MYILKSTVDANLPPGETVKKYRLLHGMSQKQLAEATGLSLSAISALECHNKLPSYDKMLKIICELDMPVHLILKSDKPTFSV